MGLVAVVADGVGIADKIEPPGGQPFRMPRRSQQLVNQLLVPVGRVGSQVGLDLSRCRGQPGQIKRDPPQQGDLIGVGRRLEPHLLQARQHESINPATGPVAILHHRRRVSLGGHIGPVRLVGGPGGNPADEQVFLFRRQHMVALRRRHDQVGVGLSDPGDQFTFVGLARHDRLQAAVEFGNRPVPLVKPQPRLPVMLVRTVAGNAVVREDRPDVVIERDCLIGSSRQQP